MQISLHVSGQYLYSGNQSNLKDTFIGRKENEDWGNTISCFDYENLVYHRHLNLSASQFNKAKRLFLLHQCCKCSRIKRGIYSSYPLHVNTYVFVLKPFPHYPSSAKNVNLVSKRVDKLF